MKSISDKSDAGQPNSGWDATSVLRYADVAIYAVDADGMCVLYNRAAEELLGYSEMEALGHDMHELIHNRYPDGTPYPVEACPLIQAKRDRRALQNLQEVLWTRSGDAVVVECSALPMPLGDGDFGTVVTIKDVRARHAAEEHHQSALREQVEALRQRDAAARIERELAESETLRQRDLSISVETAAADQLRKQQELISTVAENAPVGIAVLDATMRYRWHNPSYLQFLEAKEQSKDAAQDVESEIESILQQVQKTGQPFNADEFPLFAHNDNQTYWRLSVSRLANRDLMVLATNVTEQVNARREIEAIYATAPNALALIDARDFRYLRVNEEQAAILGRKPDEVLGKTVEEVVGIPEVSRLFERAAQGASITGQPVSGELASRPGEVRHWLMNVVPNHSKDGRVETISVAGIEVTAQKLAEEALMQADKLAAVGRLVSSISHEINNPLEAVTNLLYLVHQDESLSAESTEYIRMAEGEIARVSQIASQTLRFHRHAIGVATLTPQQVVEPVVALYQGRLKNSRVTLETHYADDQPVVCMEGDVRQILNNLVGNAIDAIGTGGRIRIRTRAASCARTGRRGTRISVSDSGHGMHAETAAHIFEPFYTTKGASGSGLGLWISHTLAERQGGVLQVRSCPEGVRKSGEQGTTFSLFLPSTATANAPVQ